ncbi:hypothetical protein JTB14_019791 [Gonioctena quinquepunctata]|nr:hypothetical protein JTB14_019791 [Gonioctena quinquepunctata]
MIWRRGCMDTTSCFIVGISTCRKKQYHPPHREKAGYDWLKGFRHRHPDIALRAPESTSTARASAFNKTIVEKYYSVLKVIQKTKNHPCHRIYNVDETSVSTVPTKNIKMFAGSGQL